MAVTSRCLSSVAKSKKLYYEVLGTLSPGESTLFLHGLLGNGKNLRGLARAVDAPSSILMDLRGHGKSSTFDDSNNFKNCALDVKRTLEDTTALSTLVGHSFGGRIALEYTHNLRVDDLRTVLPTTWLLDTVPGQANDTVERVLAAVDRVQLSTKRDVILQLRELEIEEGIAQWLAASLQSNPDNNLEWGFNVSVAQEVLEHFGQQDFLGMVEEMCVTSDATIHLVRGGKNSGWGDDPKLLPALDKLSKSLKNFHIHVLPKAGHWVHVDDLKGLVQLIHSHR